MKKSLLSLLLAVILLLTGCASVLEAISSQVGEPEASDFSGTGLTLLPPGDEEPAPVEENDAIPFARMPDIPPWTMPEEEFPDELEAEAAAIIDEAICRAVAMILTLRDDRQSTQILPYDQEDNQYLASLTTEQRDLYDQIVAAGRAGEGFLILEADYPGDLNAASFAIYSPFQMREPGLSSYMTYWTEVYISARDEKSHARSLYDLYFDPWQDGNVTVRSGEVTMERVLYGAALLDRVVQRVVRFMPEGLTAYDQYAYLAAVVSCRVQYDKRPDNCFTAFGALIGGRAVCEGISYAYELLCRQANLWCDIRTGQPEGQGHQWNMVRLESGTYNVDITWSDAYGEPGSPEWYSCFMQTDEAFAADGHNATSGPAGSGPAVPNPYQP